ncbi:hypothetical protein AYJ53_00900 [Lactobacillus johnsonii]|uniref:Uncharacterized protein n=2 Tax=Lactobacillus johnsonii TaxID=33959 RepID=A0A9X0SCA9_LACJH|nr:hypothetical protein AYJ53_00900 [Lactobacillus johnsonii]
MIFYSLEQHILVCLLNLRTVMKKMEIVNVPMQNERDYDYYFDIVGNYIATSLNEAGKLNEDGLRLEAAWDYADWSQE